ncbi:MAG: PhpK family radical SAM P-methyltransferase, partial [bacterium]|nr:PhpK family radical SAM P-methyltransferase [bacterium]
MQKMIDCLFVGHNEMDFREYEKSVRKMGLNSGAYRDLNLNFIYYQNQPHTAAEIFNLFWEGGRNTEKKRGPLSFGETFSAAIAYLGTYLHRRGFTFDYINSYQDEKEELTAKLDKGNIRTIAIITTFYVSMLPILEIIKYIKKHNGSARIIVGGPFISTQVRIQDAASIEYLFKNIDADFYVNSSQGERELVDIITAIKNNRTFDKINNIYYKTEGTYTPTPTAVKYETLAENMVDWSLFADRIGHFASIRSAISCPFSCAFCGFPEHAGRYQYVSAGLLEKELNALNRIETLKSVNFIDDTFNVPVERFKEILRMMKKNKYRFKWNSHLRCQFADREMIELMKETGCEGVFLGIESGNNQILKNMKKAATVEKYLEGLALLKEYDIMTFGSFIVGFPGETAETIGDTVRFIEESQMDFYRAQLWYCEPITPIWRENEKYKLEGSHYVWKHVTMDSDKAAGKVDRKFMQIETSTFIPQYNFDFDAIFRLTDRGLSIRQIKKYFSAFNRGVKERLLTPTVREAGIEIIKGIKQALLKEGDGESSNENNAA